MALFVGGGVYVNLYQRRLGSFRCWATQSVLTKDSGWAYSAMLPPRHKPLFVLMNHALNSAGQISLRKPNIQVGNAPIRGEMDLAALLK